MSNYSGEREDRRREKIRKKRKRQEEKKRKNKKKEGRKGRGDGKQSSSSETEEDKKNDEELKKAIAKAKQDWRAGEKMALEVWNSWVMFFNFFSEYLYFSNRKGLIKC